MMKSKPSVLIVSLSFVFILLLGAAWLTWNEFRQPRFALAAPNVSQVDWWTADSGGDISSSPTYSLQGTIGQPDAGSADSSMSSASFQVTGGFWHGTVAVETEYLQYLPSLLR
jgi:hypothetical protein